MGALVSSEDEAEDVYMEQPDATVTEESYSQHATKETFQSIAGGVVRQQGDGMEGPANQSLPSDTLPKTGSMTNSSTSIPDGRLTLAKLPKTLSDPCLSLARLPPITDNVELKPKLPTKPLVQEKAKVYPKGSYPPTVKKAREPKFVPYEPYKGAVTPLRSQAKHVERASAERKKSVVEESTANTILDKSHISSTNEEAEDAVTADKEPMSDQLSSNFRTMLDIKEKELDHLKAALENSQKQLKIQTQVNGEVKRLLVASVGEDIEARVDFLTQDKARLAADVVNYNNKISRDWEEKEALSVESDIWRSKFLASTLILEELTRGKQTSETRCHQLEHAARRILLERNQMRSSLSSSVQIISRLNAAFDPLSRGHGCNGPPAAEDLLQRAAALNNSCSVLRDRLIGDDAAKTSDKYASAMSPVHESLDTPAERELRHLLAVPAVADNRLPEQATTSLSKGARSLLLKMGDQAQSPGKNDFSTCSHCNGTVHIV